MKSNKNFAVLSCAETYLKSRACSCTCWWNQCLSWIRAQLRPARFPRRALPPVWPSSRSSLVALWTTPGCTTVCGRGSPPCAPAAPIVAETWTGMGFLCTNQQQVCSNIPGIFWRSLSRRPPRLKSGNGGTAKEMIRFCEVHLHGHRMDKWKDFFFRFFVTRRRSQRRSLHGGAEPT